ncbi:condensation domain-containing protein, partial [Kitasatospora sp. NPDC047058]|uniref:condensation domain-containing protein n=1 Tax=Kitasatospora sp. NPDC047058 TaxID=3155620 RepID=UPI00340A6138
LAPEDPPLGRRPLDPAVDTAANAVRRHLVLDPGRSAPLLDRVPDAAHAAVPDVLLTALAAAVRRWRTECGLPAGDDVLVEVEGHGRADLGTHRDLSRTVGWFTSMHPVRLAAGPGDGPVDALLRVKEQLRATPADGIGFGLLRHLNDGTRAELRALRRPQILFNYLGRLPGRGSGDWSPVTADALLHDGRDPRMPASHGLTVDVLVREVGQGPRVEAAWTAPEGWLPPAGLDRLCALWTQELDRLAEAAARQAVSRHSPSDFLLAGLTQAEVDELEAELERWA